MTRITSLKNPHLRHLELLANTTAHRRETGMFLAEGIHPVREALACIPESIQEIILADGAAAHPEVAALIAHAATLPHIETIELPQHGYAKMSALKNPEGIAVVCLRALQYPEGLLTPGARIVALAGVQDPGNAGAVVRTAAAAGADGVLFLDQSVDPTHPALLRAAMGATFRIRAESMAEEAFLAAAKRQGVRLCGAMADAATPYDRADWTPPVCIVIGAEGSGIPPSLANALDERINIPMERGVESLNAAVAAGIILYAARSAWH